MITKKKSTWSTTFLVFYNIIEIYEWTIHILIENWEYEAQGNCTLYSIDLHQLERNNPHHCDI